MAKRFIANVRGVGISGFIREYYASTSATELANGEWLTTVPTLDTTHYIWTRLKATLTNGKIEYTDPLREGMFGEEIANLEGLISDLNSDLNKQIVENTEKLTSLQNIINIISPNRITALKHGGTDADNAADARKNLGITYGTDEPTGEAEAGAVYFRLIS